MEMLIVVAVIAILVAVAIPVMNAQMHKVKVRTDWANVRAYYAELQTDYMLTGKQNPKVKYPGTNSEDYWHITFLNGQTVNLQAGGYTASFHEGKGYTIAYFCKGNDPECGLTLG